MVRKNDKYLMSVGLSGECAALIDRIIRLNPDLQNRSIVVRYCVRKYYDDVLLGNQKNNWMHNL